MRPTPAQQPSKLRANPESRGSNRPVECMQLLGIMGSRHPPPIRSIVASVLQVSVLLLLLLAEATVQKGLHVCSERVLQTGAHTSTVFRCFTMKTFIAQLAAKHPQGAALLQAENSPLRTCKVTGENKITIFAEPCVDSKKVGYLEPGVCFGVVNPPETPQF